MKNSTRKRYSKKLHKKEQEAKFFLRHPLVLPVSFFLSLFFASLVFFVALGGSTNGASDARIVNIFADGQQQTITTRAKNIGELIERLDIEIAKEDIIEPNKESLILEDNTQINIYRARPVEVVDGQRVFTLLTAQRAPRLVAKEAGVKLLPEDEVIFDRIETDVLESSASERLIVDRSVEIKLNVYGVVKLLRTTQNSVADLLKAEGVFPAENESVEPNLNSTITKGMLVSVNRPGVKTEVVNEILQFDIEFVDDAELEAGTEKIQKAGVLGERAVVYEIIQKNGKEKSRKVIQQVVLKKPENEVRLRGTKIIAPSFSSTETVSGDKSALMALAGIAESDFGFVDYIITSESRWSPGAANTSSGAYGLCQALPASKMSSAGADYLTNPVTQLKWCSGYATGRYGSWAGAYSAWLAQGWW